MAKKNMPPPPDILRKSGPQKDRSKYDRKRVKEEDRQRDKQDTDERGDKE